MTRYSHILFDHDGVLVDTEPLYFRATQQQLAHLGVDVDRAQFLAIQLAGGNAWQLVAANRQGEVPEARAVC